MKRNYNLPFYCSNLHSYYFHSFAKISQHTMNINSSTDLLASLLACVSPPQEIIIKEKENII